MFLFLSENARISTNSYPYNYLQIEDLFADAMADALRERFESGIAKGAAIGKVGEVGNLVYSAVNYTPTIADIQSSEIAVFATAALRDLICGAFGIPVNDYLMIGSHRHAPPSRNGWPHTDCAIVSFPESGPKYNGFEIFSEDSGCTYADDSRDRQPHSVKMARAVACIYYLGSEDWSEGEGGETAIYGRDGRQVVAKVPPIPNSLLAFEISPFSLHGYLGSPNLTRDSYIWWYHSDISLSIDRHRESFELKTSSGADPWDRWTDASVPKYDAYQSATGP